MMQERGADQGASTGGGKTGRYSDAPFLALRTCRPPCRSRRAIEFENCLRGVVERPMRQQRVTGTSGNTAADSRRFERGPFGTHERRTGRLGRSPQPAGVLRHGGGNRAGSSGLFLLESA
jgi:hypothetical protein